MPVWLMWVAILLVAPALVVIGGLLLAAVIVDMKCMYRDLSREWRRK